MQEDKELINKILNNPLYIREVENPSEELILKAIGKNPSVIQYINNKLRSEVINKTAVKLNPLVIEYIEDPSEDISIMAVKILWNSLRYIKKPSYNVLKEAVKAKGWAIQFIEDKTEELCLLAVSKDYDSIKYIENPSEEVQLIAVKKYWGAIKYIKKPTLLVMREAVKREAEAINFIERYDYDDIKYFIYDNINTLKYVYESIDMDMVLDVLQDKFSRDEIDREYIIDFYNLEILDMDKLAFIKEWGSKEAKKILVDYILN